MGAHESGKSLTPEVACEDLDEIEAIERLVKQVLENDRAPTGELLVSSVGHSEDPALETFKANRNSVEAKVCQNRGIFQELSLGEVPLDKVSTSAEQQRFRKRKRFIVPKDYSQ